MRRSGDRWGGRWDEDSDEERFSTWGRRGGYGGFREDEPRGDSGRWRESGSESEGAYGGGSSDQERERWESGSGERFGRGSEYGEPSYEGSRGSSDYGRGRGGESFGGGEGGWSREGREGQGSSSGGRYSGSWGGGGGYSGRQGGRYQGGGFQSGGSQGGGFQGAGYRGGYQGGGFSGRQSGGHQGRQSGGESGERWGRSGSEWAGGMAATGFGPTGYGSSRGSSAYGGSSMYGGYGSETGFQSGQRRTGKRRMPKGYTRSDERIREDICDRLSEADVECEEVTVTVRSGEVTLAGRAPSGDARREIEQIAENVSGVQDVTNQIRTRPDESGKEETDESGNGSKAKRTQESSFAGSSSRQGSTSKSS